MGLTTVENGALYLAGKSDESWLGPEGENPRYKFTDSTSDILLLKFTYGSFPWTMMLPAIIGDGHSVILVLNVRLA